jgi:curved DNA-binding protein CbpA
MESQSYHEIMGVREGASRREIAQAYRRLARRYHPDLQPPERKQWAEERMKMLNEAYAALYGSRKDISNDIVYWQRRAAEHRRRRQGSPELRRFVARVKAAVDILLVSFLMVGMYCYFLDWDSLLQESFTSGQIVGLRILVANAWMGALGVLVLRMVPRRG